jgi:predicted  nucleic acid-binding Zn-ribbon protein
MPHQCTYCGKIYPDAAGELLSGCSCGSKFFYYIKEGLMGQVQETIDELNNADKVQIEKDIRDITGLDEEPERPIILDLESW